jgi:hypothetical protein
VDGTVPWDRGSPYARTGLLWTHVSTDEGRSWSEPEQLIVQGEDMDQSHWAPGVCFGNNGAIVEGQSPVWTSEDQFLLPMCGPEPDQSHRWQSCCLVGTWRPDADGVDWEARRFVSARREYSNAGGDEPSLVRLPDGRLLMTLRVRVDPNDGTTLPSGKLYTISEDLGQTWSDPEPIRYADGDQVYCPACLGHVFVSSRNGRLYLITNILDTPTTGCDPRTTLHVAEMDLDSLCVIRNTVTPIETRDVATGQPPNIRFSNWRRYEDRETGNMVLYMTACPGNVGRSAECGCPPHSYRYEIVLPD